MALTKDDIRLAAERLHQAQKTRRQIRQLSLDHPGITIEDAYAIQKAWIEIKLAEGRVVKGHKIGLTSKAMQSALGIDEPDSGVLLDDMFFAEGGLVPSDRFIGTRVEAELAFVMKARLAGPDCTMFDVLNATDFVVPHSTSTWKPSTSRWLGELTRFSGWGYPHPGERPNGRVSKDGPHGQHGSRRRQRGASSP